MKYKIIIKRSLCQSAATCVAMAPEIYMLDDEFKAIVGNTASKTNGDDWAYEVEVDNKNSKKLKQIITGAEACPYKAIEVYDDKGKKLYPK